MAKTLTIAGGNHLPYLKTNSVSIRELIQNKSNEMTAQLVFKAGDTIPSAGSEIIYKEGSRFLFAGFISRMTPVEQGIGQQFRYEIECTDYTYILNNKTASRGYTNKTLEFIVEDLLDYYTSSYSIDDTNVQTGPTIASVTFDHVSLRACLEKLAKLTGYVWWIDYEKNLYFQQKQTDSAPETITDSSGNHSELQIVYDTTQVRNQIVVIGSENGEQSDSLNVESFNGDDETRSWVLEEKPSQIVTITLNTVVQQFSLDLNEREDDVFVYSFNDQQVKLTEGETTPASSGPDVIEVTYYPRIPIIVTELDATSIAALATLEGGDGVHRYTIKDSSITTRAEATDRAQQELEEFSAPLVNGVFKTSTSLLGSSSVFFKAGQILTVNSPSYDIDNDTPFLIQEVITTMVEDEPSGSTEYIYTVKFGGKIVDIERFLETLANQGSDVANVDRVLTIESASDIVAIDDNTPTDTIQTPPFKWKTGSPQGVWGLSEWS